MSFLKREKNQLFVRKGKIFRYKGKTKTNLYKSVHL